MSRRAVLLTVQTAAARVVCAILPTTLPVAPNGRTTNFIATGTPQYLSETRFAGEHHKGRRFISGP